MLVAIDPHSGNLIKSNPLTKTQSMMITIQLGVSKPYLDDPWDLVSRL